jgi:hypothetical protein
MRMGILDVQHLRTATFAEAAFSFVSGPILPDSSGGRPILSNALGN